MKMEEIPKDMLTGKFSQKIKNHLINQSDKEVITP